MVIWELLTAIYLSPSWLTHGIVTAFHCNLLTILPTKLVQGDVGTYIFKNMLMSLNYQFSLNSKQ